MAHFPGSRLINALASARGACALLVWLLASVLGAATVSAEVRTNAPDGFCSQVRHYFPGDASAVETLPEDAVVGRVEVLPLDVFDPSRPGEDRLVFRAANRFHVNTREGVIERKLLFRSGDRFDARELAESERYLRSLGFLYDACIEPVAVRGREVDVRVVARDVWTLGAGASFERGGGENTLNLRLHDTNALGTGRLLALQYVDDPDRSERLVLFQDPAFFDDRLQLQLKYSDRSDGHRRTLDLFRPFYALDSRWSAGTRWVSDLGRVRIYAQGEEVTTYMQEASFLELRGGISAGHAGHGARRWLYGFTWDENVFSSEPDADRPGGEPPAGRTLAYPWIGFQWVGDGFIETRNVDQLVRTEDLNLASELTLRLGYSTDALGADRNQAIAFAAWDRGWAIGPGQMAFLRTWAEGRLGDGAPQNVLLGARFRHFFPTFGPHQLHTTLQVDAADDLDPERQLLLGGDNGLRGYPHRFRDGDRRWLASLEHRFYTGWEILKTVNVGAAVFLDAGRAWYADGAPPGVDDGRLRNVGVGLRLASSRSAKGRMVHLDVAYPLDGDERDLQWLVRSRETF